MLKPRELVDLSGAGPLTLQDRRVFNELVQNACSEPVVAARLPASRIAASEGPDPSLATKIRIGKISPAMAKVSVSSDGCVRSC